VPELLRASSVATDDPDVDIQTRFCGYTDDGDQARAFLENNPKKQQVQAHLGALLQQKKVVAEAVGKELLGHLNQPIYDELAVSQKARDEAAKLVTMSEDQGRGQGDEALVYIRGVRLSYDAATLDEKSCRAQAKELAMPPTEEKKKLAPHPVVLLALQGAMAALLRLLYDITFSKATALRNEEMKKVLAEDKIEKLATMLYKRLVELDTNYGALKNDATKSAKGGVTSASNQRAQNTNRQKIVAAIARGALTDVAWELSHFKTLKKGGEQTFHVKAHYVVIRGELEQLLPNAEQMVARISRWAIMCMFGIWLKPVQAHQYRSWKDERATSRRC
jgi:hypothetical protein